MFDAAGWEVHDLGRDVKLEQFTEAMVDTRADVVGLSALMTTSMLGIPKVIEDLKSQNADIKVIVGGAPLNLSLAQQYGADAYAANSVEAVKEGVRLLMPPS